MNKTYSNITPAQITSFREQLAARGIAVPAGNGGHIVWMGFNISFFYDVGVSTLSLVIVDKPFLFPAALLWSRLNSYLGVTGV